LLHGMSCCRSLHSQQADGGTGAEPTEQVATYQQPGLDYSLQRRDTTPVYPHMIASTQHIQSEYVGTALTVLQDIGATLLLQWAGGQVARGACSTAKAPNYIRCLTYFMRARKGIQRDGYWTCLGWNPDIRHLTARSLHLLC
jgi:hypothetical protein